MANIAGNFSIVGGNYVSQSFFPSTAFVVQATGAITNNTYKLQQIPDNLEDDDTNWQDTPLGTTVTEISDSARILIGNYAKGFKYRIIRSGTGTSTPTFYWGNSTNVRYTYG